MSKKILLVGGAGYIGSVLTEKFLKKNYKVKCLDALIYSQRYCIKPFLKKHARIPKKFSDFEFLTEIKIFSKLFL